MSVKKRHTNLNTFYFITFTCFKWLNLIEITGLYDFIRDWFEILERIKIYNCGYVIMPNHLHLLLFTTNSEKTIDKIIGNGKRFMAYEIVKRLKLLEKKDVLKLMSEAVSLVEKQRNKKHQVFEESFDCKEVITENFIRQKLNYIHKNPVSGKWKLVENYLDYEFSSARFYDLGEKSNCKLFHYQSVSSESPV